MNFSYIRGIRGYGVYLSRHDIIAVSRTHTHTHTHTHIHTHTSIYLSIPTSITSTINCNIVNKKKHIFIWREYIDYIETGRLKVYQYQLISESKDFQLFTV